jgi:hypothetical protein
LNEQIQASIPCRISRKKINLAAKTVWRYKRIAARIGREAERIIFETYGRNHFFFNAKGFRRIISGLFFLLGYKYNVAISEVELANRLGTTDVHGSSFLQGLVGDLPRTVQGYSHQAYRKRNPSPICSTLNKIRKQEQLLAQ